MEIEPNLSHASKFYPINFQIKKLQLFHFYCYESGHPFLKIFLKSGHLYLEGFPKKQSPLSQRDNFPYEKQQPLSQRVLKKWPPSVFPFVKGKNLAGFAFLSREQ